MRKSGLQRGVVLCDEFIYMVACRDRFHKKKEVIFKEGWFLVMRLFTLETCRDRCHKKVAFKEGLFLVMRLFTLETCRDRCHKKKSGL